MRSTLTTLARLIPLAAASFLMAADGDACIILQGGDDDGGGREGEGEGEECPELGRLCPSLVCDAGFVVDDVGCPICECKPVCAEDVVAAAPECANATFDETTCTWSCGGGECRADADCGANSFCVDGICRGLGAGCFSDADCGPGFSCSFASAEEPRPPPPDGGGEGGGGGAAPAPVGQCVPLPPCFSDADCADGERCVPLDQAGGLVAISSVCVADPSPECTVDEECPLGQRCLLGCTGSCPECDDCTVIVGTCAEVAMPCDSDAQCRRGETCLFGDPAARPCLDANGDDQCDDIGSDPLPPQGVCGVVPVVPGCFTDADCGPGGVCRAVDDCGCAAVCIDDGQGGCLPCDCQPVPGACDTIRPGDEECVDDTQCAEGEKCVIYTVGCENACVILDDGTMDCHACDPLAVGRCEFEPTFCGGDVDCGPGEYCEFGGLACPAIAPECPEGQVVADVDGDGCALECADATACPGADGCMAPIPPPGVCLPQPTDPCARVRCRDGAVCIVDSAGNAACLEDPCVFVRCSDDTHCEAQRDGTAQCISNVPNCRNAEECEAGLRCTVELDGDCWSNPTCGTDVLCTDECWGFCVAR